MSRASRVELGPQPEIPAPEILGDRGVHAHQVARLDDNATPAEYRQILDSVQSERDRLAAYALALWGLLGDVGEYLRADVAAASAHRSSPLQDDADWARWQQIYAAVLSSRAGPAGDEGYGFSEARLTAQQVRATEPPDEPA